MANDQLATKSSITVGDMTIETMIHRISIDNLHYYSDNPRIFSILKQLSNQVTQEEIERKLWEQDSTKDLYQDIKRNGGLLEEIIVRGQEVLEGNSRLCAYRYLRKHAIDADDEEAVKKWSFIRAKKIPDDITDETVFGILGILHIRGKAQWRPYEQASYLFRQLTAFSKKPTDLANQIGVKETEVENMIEAYKLMEGHKITDPNRFSYFVEFAKSRKLHDTKEYLPTGVVLEDKFSEWVKENKIPRADAVRDLPIILKDNSARKKFMGGQLTFEEALEVARDRHPEAVSSFYNKLKKAAEAMSNAEESSIREEVAKDPQKKFIVTELYKTARRFARAVGIDVPQADREKRSSRSK
jgi:hypothetical protein